MAHDVFISHSRHDKPVADAVCAALENAAIRCWVAPRDVQPGRSFAGEITRAVQDSKAMVLIFSSHSNNSEQVLREVQLAVKHHVHILQFRIERVVLSDDFSYFLGTPHWLDALTPPLEAHLQRLVDSIKILLAPPDRVPVERVAGDRFVSATPTQRPAAPLLDKRKWIAAAAVLSCLGFLVWWFVRPERNAPTPEITHFSPGPVVPPALPQYSVAPENPPQTSGTVYNPAEEYYRQQTDPSVAPQFEVPVRRRAILQHEDRVNDANFSADGRFIVTASDDKTARIWDAKTGQAVGEPLKHESQIKKAMFTSDGRRIITISNDVRFWDATTQKEIGEPLGTKNLVTATLSPDGKRVAITERLVYDRQGKTVDQDETRIWDIEQRQLIGETLRSKTYYGDHLLLFSPDGKRLLTSAGEKAARLWDVESGNPVGDILRHAAEVASASFSSNGKVVATWASGTKARVWNAETGEQLLELETDTGYSDHQILFSPNAECIVAIVGQGYPGKIFDAKTGAPRSQELLLAHAPVVFSSDSKKIVAGGSSGEDAAWIWDVETGRLVTRKLKHDGEIVAIHFSPDGKLLVTGSYDNTARVWEIGAQ
jgi:WD40 repeat protein